MRIRGRKDKSDGERDLGKVDKHLERSQEEFREIHVVKRERGIGNDSDKKMREKM